MKRITHKPLKLSEADEPQKKVEIPASLVSKIAKFKELSDKIDAQQKILAGLTKEFAEFETEIAPVKAQMEALGEKIVIVDKLTIALQRVGFDRTNPKYKEAFEEALTKVNATTKKVLEEILKANSSVSKVSATFATKFAEASWFKKFGNWIKSTYSSVVASIKQSNKEMDSAIKDLQKLMTTKESKLKESVRNRIIQEISGNKTVLKEGHGWTDTQRCKLSYFEDRD